MQIGHEPIRHGFGLHHQLLWLIFKLTRFGTKKVISGHVCENVSGRYLMIWEDPSKLKEKEKVGGTLPFISLCVLVVCAV